MHTISKPKAKYMMVGWGPSLSCIDFIMQATFTRGFLGGGHHQLQVFAAGNKTEEHGKIATWIAEGKVKPVIDSKFLMEDAVDAFRKLKSGRAGGKIVVEVAER